MARLTAAQRKSLPDSTFAGPDRSFSIPDKNHAKAALGLINNAPASARPAIRAKAEAILHDCPTCGGTGKVKGDGDADDSDGSIVGIFRKRMAAKRPGAQG